MATKDFTKNGDALKKRGVSVGVYNFTGADFGTGDTLVLANLPADIFITNATVFATGGAGSTINLKANGSAAQAVATHQQTRVAWNLKVPNGGQLTAEAGATAPTGEIKLLIEYIEYEKSTGEYTR